MKIHSISQMGRTFVLAAAGLALFGFCSASSASPTVRVEFLLDTLTLDQLPGASQTLPSTGTLTLTFDAGLRAFTDGPIQEVFFNAHNTFVSSLTSFVPLAPLYPSGNQDPRNLAVLDNVIADTFSFAFWDDQYRHFDGQFDYLYRISLDTNSPGNANPFVADAANFGSAELIGYLTRMMQTNEPLQFAEWGFVHDPNAHAFLRNDAISGLAHIVSITTIPLPASGPLMMLALVGFGLRQRRLGRRMAGAAA